MTDVNQTYCGHHFIINISQAIMLYTLKLYLCPLYLNKTEKKTNNSKWLFIKKGITLAG